jgi:hypothetical protein
MMWNQLACKFTGFKDTFIGKTSLNPMEIYAERKLAVEFVFLTPDSPNVMTEFSTSKVYRAVFHGVSMDSLKYC